MSAGEALPDYTVGDVVSPVEYYELHQGKPYSALSEVVATTTGKLVYYVSEYDGITYMFERPVLGGTWCPECVCEQEYTWRKALRYAPSKCLLAGKQYPQCDFSLYTNKLNRDDVTITVANIN